LEFLFLQWFFSKFLYRALTYPEVYEPLALGELAKLTPICYCCDRPTVFS
jgi:hypothetical protein